MEYGQVNFRDMNRTLLHLVVLVVGVIACVNDASAQSIDRMRAMLNMRSDSGAKVRVEEDGNVKAVVAAVEGQAAVTEVDGYRVVLYYDDVQYAQDRAEEIIKDFKKDFPEINSYLVYEKPYFKVSIGDCLSMEEALMLRSKVLTSYPSAFIRRDKVTFKSLMDARRRVDCLEIDPEVRENLLHNRELRDSMRMDETLYIVMQRDEELNKLLQLDDLSRQQENNNQTEQDPEWIDEW